MSDRKYSEFFEKKITLVDLYKVLMERLWILLAAMAIAIALLAAYYTMVVSPKYESTAVIYILKQSNESENTSATNSDFNLALNVVSDCTFLLKSHAVLDEVLELLDKDYTYEELSNSISTSNPSDTRILEVSVVADSPSEAKEIVDTLCDVGARKITEAMKFKQVNLYEYGTMEDKPCNIMPRSHMVLFGLIIVLVIYVIFCILYVFDDRLKTDEDIENLLDTVIIGRIPSADARGRRKVAHPYGVYGKK